MGRLRETARHPFGQRKRPGRPAYLASAVNLLNEGLSAELAGALRKRGLRGIVLKGPALRRWLYGDTSERMSLDIDLLISWDDLEAVEGVLRGTGWRYLGIDAVGEDRPHCRVWERPDNGLILELHRTLPGIGASPAKAWAILRSHTEELAIGSARMEVLDVAARAFHVALHATQHGMGLERTQEDLRRAAGQVSLSAWREAAGIAGELEAMPAFTTGLAMVAEGRALLASLGLEVERSTEAALRASGAPPMVEGLGWVVRQRGWRAKASFAARHVVPPPGYMRVWFPAARRGRLGLVAAYVWRPIWLLLCIGPAVKAWLGARRVSG
jgi:Uncharacterised nucleotidyltransferase